VSVQASVVHDWAKVGSTTQRRGLATNAPERVVPDDVDVSGDPERPTLHRGVADFDKASSVELNARGLILARATKRIKAPILSDGQ
jgi:hypothetical protein